MKVKGTMGSVTSGLIISVFTALNENINPRDISFLGTFPYWTKNNGEKFTLTQATERRKVAEFIPPWASPSIEKDLNYSHFSSVCFHSIALSFLIPFCTSTRPWIRWTKHHSFFQKKKQYFPKDMGTFMSKLQQFVDPLPEWLTMMLN